jgi:hypothetical protein
MAQELEGAGIWLTRGERAGARNEVILIERSRLRTPKNANRLLTGDPETAENIKQQRTVSY